MRYFFLFFIVMFFNQLFGQRTIFIRDARTESPVPFAKVFPDYGDPFLADLDGAIRISEEVKQVTIKYSGYFDTTVLISAIPENIIFIREDIQTLDEIVVVPGVNRAHRIIDLAIANRKKNNPMGDDAFRYKSYSKFVLDMNPEAIKAIPENTTDSSLIGIKEFFDAQHLFLMESASERTFIPPYRDKEEVLAYKISGFTDPSLSTFANSLQSFSFYDTQFDILGTTYINPIALGGTKRYLFILQDTTINDSDTTFTIFYRPRKGKKFDGLTGKLYINTNGYAIEKVTAAPYGDTNKTHVNIIQEYTFIDGKKWFPSKLTTSLRINDAIQVKGIDNGYLEGTGRTYIEDIELNPEFEKKGYNDNLVLVTDPDASELDSSDWSRYRRYELTKKEKQTYHHLDSLSDEHDFDGKLKLLTTLMSGKIPVWKFDLPIERLINYNLYEKYRIGFGLQTSDRLWKHVMLGGYFAYGTGDKVWKYGGESKFYFSHKRGLFLHLKYQQDVAERGGNEYNIHSTGLLDPSGLRQFFIAGMENQRLGEIALQGDIKANLTLRLSAAYQRLWFTQDYHFISNDTVSRTDVFETSAELYWSPMEKFMLLGTNKFSLGAKHPRFRFKITRGWSEVFESQFDYLRLSLSIGHHIDFKLAGSIDWSVTGNKTIGNAPILVNHVVNGTGIDWSLTVLNSFETVSPASFYHTQQAAVFLRYSFPAIKTKANWNEPTFSIHQASGYGTFRNPERHELNFNTMENGYHEAGLILDGLLVSGFTKLGVAAFYNYGSYASGDWRQNIVPKFSATFSF